MENRKLPDQLDIPFHEATPERDEWREIRAGFANLAERGHWVSLLERLRGVDQSRQEFISGKRYYDSALAGAIGPVTRHLTPILNLDGAIGELKTIRRIAAENEADYVASILLATALAAVGNAMRSEHKGEESGRKPPHRTYFEQAEAALSAFDPIVENSPMLAETRYKLVDGLGAGGQVLRDWYEDWADLDPSNPLMLVAHGRNLMPGRFGSYDEIEREARRAVERAKGGLGAGAYCMFWRPALTADTANLSRIDPDLFLDGICEALDKTQSQHLANDFAACIYDLVWSEAKGPKLDPMHLSVVRSRLAQGFGKVLRNHLREIRTPIWRRSEAVVRAIIAQEFREDISRGKVIRPGSKGLEAAYPAPDSE